MSFCSAREEGKWGFLGATLGAEAAGCLGTVTVILTGNSPTQWGPAAQTSGLVGPSESVSSHPSQPLLPNTHQSTHPRAVPKASRAVLLLKSGFINESLSSSKHFHCLPLNPLQSIYFYCTLSYYHPLLIFWLQRGPHMACRGCGICVPGERISPSAQ